MLLFGSSHKLTYSNKKLIKIKYFKSILRSLCLYPRKTVSELPSMSHGHNVYKHGDRTVPRFCFKKTALPNWNSSSCFHISGQLNQSSVFVNVEKEKLELNVRDTCLEIPFVWLRDHCRSNRFYNSETKQKIPQKDLLNQELTPMSVTVNENFLSITWADQHESKFSLDWLVDNFDVQTQKNRTHQLRLMWDKTKVEAEPLPVVSYSDHMTKDVGLQQTIYNLFKYGFAIVNEVSPSIEATQSVVERVSFVQETLYGRMWSFTSDGSRSDTAYSTIAIGPHTDTSYMDSPSGIQVFQCLEHTGSGGKTLLVDGFRAMDQLRRNRPVDFDILTKTVVPHEYQEKPSSNSPGYHLYSLGTVCSVHPTTGSYLQIRYNPYDRAPLNTVSTSNIKEFYSAYARLTEYIEAAEGHFWLKLQPGMVLFVDNWRVLHGRSGFDGTRRLCGCYLPREIWTSKARIMGLL